MISHTEPRFWNLYRKLPKEIQAAAEKAFKIFQENPNHSLLNFKPLKGDSDFYSVRITLKYRAVAQRRDGVLIWFWIGTHSDFDKNFS